MKNHTLSELLVAYNNNKDLIEAYVNKQSIEGYDSRSILDNDNNKNILILGMALELFLVVLILHIILWVWAVMLLINNWYAIPFWVKLISIVGIMPFVPYGALVTIILISATKKY